MTEEVFLENVEEPPKREVFTESTARFPSFRDGRRNLIYQPAIGEFSGFSIRMLVKLDDIVSRGKELRIFSVLSFLSVKMTANKQHRGLS